jgi:hypothetical protein
MCGTIQMMHKPGQRLTRIDRASVSDELTRFAEKFHTFASNREHNDMWLEIDFGASDSEISVVHYVKNFLGQHDRPLSRAPSRYTVDSSGFS